MLMTFVEYAMQHGIPVIRTTLLPPTGMTPALHSVKQSDVHGLRLSHVHALACSSRAGYQVAELLLNPLRTIVLERDPSTIESAIGKHPLPSGIAHVLAFQYLCSCLLNHAKPDEVLILASNFAPLLNRLPVGTCIKFEANAYVRALGWMVCAWPNQWDEVLPALSRSDQSTISVLVNEKTSSGVIVDSAIQQEIEYLRSIALAHPSELQTTIDQHPFPFMVARLLAFQYLCQRLIKHAQEEEPAEIASFTRNFADLLDTVPAQFRIRYAKQTFRKFRGLTPQDLSEIIYKLPTLRSDQALNFHLKICSYEEPIRGGNIALRASHFHRVSHPGVFSEKAID